MWVLEDKKWRSSTVIRHFFHPTGAQGSWQPHWPILFSVCGHRAEASWPQTAFYTPTHKVGHHSLDPVEVAASLIVFHNTIGNSSSIFIAGGADSTEYNMFGSTNYPRLKLILHTETIIDTDTIRWYLKNTYLFCVWYPSHPRITFP